MSINNNEITELVAKIDSLTKWDLLNVLSEALRENNRLKEEIEQVSQGFEYWETQYNKLKEGVQKFVEQYSLEGSKTYQGDCLQMVSCKDIWKLRKLIN